MYIYCRVFVYLFVIIKTIKKYTFPFPGTIQNIKQERNYVFEEIKCYTVQNLVQNWHSAEVKNNLKTSQKKKKRKKKNNIYKVFCLQFCSLTCVLRSIESIEKKRFYSDLFLHCFWLVCFVYLKHIIETAESRSVNCEMSLTVQQEVHLM